MSTNVVSQKTENKGRKKKKKKRSASSPLSELERPVKSGCVSDNGDQNNTNNGVSVSGVTGQYKQYASQGFKFDNFFVPNMAFSQPFGGFAFSSQNSYPLPVQSPPMQAMPSMLGGPSMNNQPPEWATVLMNDVKAIKSQVSKIENIEKTMNQMCGKIKDLEVNVGNIDKRLLTVEKSCSFISSQHDDHKKELETAKRELKKMKTTCDNLEKNAKTLQNDKSTLESKLNDLEYRSMRDNLMFYGVPEQENEDCENRIKALIAEKLEISQAGSISFDRVHRVGPFSHGKIRPIVAKFHYYKEREVVRNKSFELSDKLKAERIGIGAQWPKQMRDTRKTLHAIMQQERAKGNTAKIVKDKLYVNGHLYVQSPTSAPAPEAAEGP